MAGVEQTFESAAELGDAELSFRIAVVREAKLMKYAHHDVDRLGANELDIVLSAPMGYSAAILEKWSGESTTLKPCAHCGERYGRCSGGKTRPTRIRGDRFGVPGKLCEGCYDLLSKRMIRLSGKE
jgi:hypothetical protein